MEVDAGVGTLIWTFLNSPIGVVLVCSFLGWVLKKVFTAKPEWEKVFTENKALFIQAVKFAEAQIPADTENATLAKADTALQFVLRMGNGMTKVKGQSLRQALTAAHKEMEEKQNKKAEQV